MFELNETYVRDVRCKLNLPGFRKLKARRLFNSPCKYSNAEFSSEFYKTESGCFDNFHSEKQNFTSCEELSRTF
jgi:hypothetical protein